MIGFECDVYPRLLESVFGREKIKIKLVAIKKSVQFVTRDLIKSRVLFFGVCPNSDGFFGNFWKKKNLKQAHYKEAFTLNYNFLFPNKFMN